MPMHPRKFSTGGAGRLLALLSLASLTLLATTVVANEQRITIQVPSNTLIISQHDQPDGFDFNPLAPGTKFGTAFGGLSGPGGTNGPWGVSRAFRVWAPAPPPPPAPMPLAQRVFQVTRPPDPLGMPGVMNQLEIKLLYEYDSYVDFNVDGIVGE